MHFLNKFKTEDSEYFNNFLDTENLKICKTANLRKKKVKLILDLQVSSAIIHKNNLKKQAWCLK